MKRLVRPLAIMMAVVALSACLERKQTGMINPDGSGKVVVDTLVAVPPEMAAGGQKPDAAAMGKQMATAMISKAQGVDAWKDVAIDVAADGRAHIVATAYFPDISKMKLDAAVPMKWTRDDKGNFTLAISKEEPPASKDPPKMTDEEVSAAVQKSKTEFKDNQAMAQMILGSLKIEMIYTMPGQITDANILSKSADGKTVTLTIEGKKMLEAMDKIMADDKAIEASIRAGKGVDQDDDLMLEKMFGKKGPISATVAGPGKPLFDYKTEMEAAKAAQAAMLKKLDIDPNAKPPGMPPMTPDGQ
jgi:hypothetical protein